MHVVVKERTHYKEHHTYHVPLTCSETAVPLIIKGHAQCKPDEDTSSSDGNKSITNGTKGVIRVSKNNVEAEEPKKVIHNINLCITIKTEGFEKKTKIPNIFTFTTNQVQEKVETSSPSTASTKGYITLKPKK